MLVVETAAVGFGVNREDDSDSTHPGHLHATISLESTAF